MNDMLNKMCIVYELQVSWQAIEKPYDDDFTGEDPSSVDTPDNSYRLELLPSTTYRIEVSAYNSKYPTTGEPEVIEAATDPSTSKFLKYFVASMQEYSMCILQERDFASYLFSLNLQIWSLFKRIHHPWWKKKMKNYISKVIIENNAYVIHCFKNGGNHVF